MLRNPYIAIVIQQIKNKIFMAEHKNDPLHGITLEMIVTYLVEYYGWEELGFRIKIKSFNHYPSIKSSLAFLRKTPWAREKVENLYLYTKRQEKKSSKNIIIEKINSGENINENEAESSSKSPISLNTDI